MPPLDYHAMFDHAADGLAVIDSSFRIVAANRAIGQLLGVSPQELVGRSLAELIDAGDLGAHPLETARITMEGSRTTHRRLRGANGTTVEAEVRSTQLPDGSVLCAVRATAPRAVDEELRDSEARFRTVAENVNA
ncbi:MAG TPA: PAS domain-containing protein, partial [Gemmatimonadaceae bacterium]